MTKAFLLSVGLLFAAAADAAPRGYHDTTNETAIREMRDTIEDIRSTSSNNESDLREMDERLKNMETIFDTLRKQVNDNIQGSKEALHSQTTNLEAKIRDLELATKGLVSDVRQIKNHTNDSAGAFTQYKQKLLEIEKVLDVQTQNIDNLQSAMKALMDAFQVKDSVGVSGEKVYRVKPGDTLDKIAIANRTSIKTIKELNNLSNDKIIVGQKLKMP